MLTTFGSSGAGLGAGSGLPIFVVILVAGTVHYLRTNPLRRQGSGPDRCSHRKKPLVNSMISGLMLAHYPRRLI
jgi:hypothetical protein